MFTGIIEEIGKVLYIGRKNGITTLNVMAKKIIDSLSIGDSVAIDGVCLTVTKKEKDWFSVEISAETLSKTTFSELKVGGYVNLERAMTLDKGLSGHLVTGHVDGVGIIQSIFPQSDSSVLIRFKYPSSIANYLVPKGSIAVDGVSLTIVDVYKNYFTVSLIPHTLKNTTLGLKRVNSKVNIEADILAKYVFSCLKKLNLSSVKNLN